MGKASGAALQPVGFTGASSTLAAASGDVHLYFLAGQSNMVGLANGSALSAALMARLQDLSQPEDPAAPITYYAATHAGGASTSYARKSCVMNSERDHRVLDRSSRDFQKVERLPFGPVTACDWERVVYDLPSRFGPELAFGLALHEQWPSQQFVLKRAVCGASMADDGTPEGGHAGLDARRSSGRARCWRTWRRSAGLQSSTRRACRPRLLQGEAGSTSEGKAKAYRSISSPSSRSCGRTRAKRSCPSYSWACPARRSRHLGGTRATWTRPSGMRRKACTRWSSCGTRPTGRVESTYPSARRAA